MPNIPLPSSRYCPSRGVSCKFHQPHYALPSILFAYLGRRVEESSSVLSVSTCHKNDFLSSAVEVVFSLTLSKGKENSWRNLPKVFSPVAHGVIAQTRNVFGPTLSVAFPNSWAVRERSVHHHIQHLSQAGRGTPQVDQPPLVSMIAGVKNQNTRNISSTVATQAGVHQIYHILWFFFTFSDNYHRPPSPYQEFL